MNMPQKTLVCTLLCIIFLPFVPAQEQPRQYTPESDIISIKPEESATMGLEFITVPDDRGNVEVSIRVNREFYQAMDACASYSALGVVNSATEELITGIPYFIDLARDNKSEVTEFTLRGGYDIRVSLFVSGACDRLKQGKYIVIIPAIAVPGDGNTSESHSSH
jgi:hypothetical protein